MRRMSECGCVDVREGESSKYFEESSSFTERV